MATVVSSSEYMVILTRIIQNNLLTTRCFWFYSHPGGSSGAFCSSTQKHDALSVTEVELYAAGITAQDIVYVIHELLSVGLFVELPVVLDVETWVLYIWPITGMSLFAPDIMVYDNIFSKN